MASPPCWTSSSHITTGRPPSPRRRITRRMSACRSPGPPKRTIPPAPRSSGVAGWRSSVNAAASGPAPSMRSQRACTSARASPSQRRCRASIAARPSCGPGDEPWSARSTTPPTVWWARSPIHSASRDFPLPAAPARTTTRAPPSATTARSASQSASRSAVRSTIGTVRRPYNASPAPRSHDTLPDGSPVRQDSGSEGREGVGDATSSIAASAQAASAADERRSAGSFANNRPSHASSPGGVGASARRGGTGAVRCACTTCARLPENTPRPVASTQARQPTA